MPRLHVKNNSIINVICPANIATGGPELLHQLVYKLNNLGLNTFMYYYNRERNINPIHDSYKNYNNPYVDKIEDNLDNIIIVPEVRTNMIYHYRNIQKVIWWLSIDNYYKAFNLRINKNIKPILYNLGILKIYKFKNDKNIFHFVQSKYAKQYLLNKGIENIDFLSDYLNDLFIEKQLNNMNKQKKDIVVYNPIKGFGFTKKIMEFAKNLEFLPIQNMTRKEVANLFSIAKVYIDFGNHPGKDRIPRESAISGCCVITNNQGSAKYYEDIPIPNEFKFTDIDSSIPQIVSKINDCFTHYNTNIQKFEEYRNMIKHEEIKFDENIKKIFLN